MFPITLLLNKRKEFRIISWGGIGDALLLTPVFKAIKVQYPAARITVYYPNHHKPVFLHNPHIDSLRKYSLLAAPLAMLRYRFDPGAFHVPAYGMLYPSKFYHHSASEIMAEMMNTAMPDRQIAIYLTEQECKAGASVMATYRNPVVMQTVSMCSDNKNWPVSKWEKLVAAMPLHTFIQLGSKGEPPIAGAVQMLGLSLRESFALLKHAAGFVGPDSCLAHASNAFHVPGVVLFGPSTPIVWGHPTNINLYRGLPCSPCIDILLGEPCPYGKKCMEFTVEEVKNALLTQIAAYRSPLEEVVPISDSDFTLFS